MRNINSVFLTVLKKAITKIQIRHEDSDDVMVHIKQDLKEDIHDEDSSSVWGVISHYVSTKEIIYEIADEIFKLKEPEFIKKDLIMMLLDYSEREIFDQLQLWWDFLSSNVTEEIEDPNKVIVVVDSKPLHEIPKNVTHFIFEGEEIPSWFFKDFAFLEYNNLISIVGENIKELDLHDFGSCLNLEEINTPKAALLNTFSYFKHFTKLKILICEQLSFDTILPNSLEYFHCSSIWGAMYINCYEDSGNKLINLKKVVINGVKKLIDNYAFPPNLEYLEALSLEITKPVANFGRISKTIIGVHENDKR